MNGKGGDDEIDGISERMRAMEEQITNLEVTRDEQYIDIQRLTRRVEAIERGTSERDA